MKKVEKILKNKFIKDIYETAKNLNKKIFLVGGAVRDLILNKKEIRDFDFVCIGDPIDIVNELSKKWNKKFKSFPFKTYEFELDSFEFDFAMARKERYPEPGALPEIEETDKIEEDLKRRDFTINAIALLIYPEFKIIDIFKGTEDIKNKKIKVLKKESFKEDPTRAIRAVKYKVKLNFNIEIEEKEFEFAKKFIKNVSFPRIRKELKEISELKERKEIIKELLDLNLLKSYFSESLEENQKIIEFMEIFDRKLGEFSKGEWIYILSILIKNKNYIEKIENLIEKNEKREFLNAFKNQKKRIYYEMSPKSFLISLLKSEIPYHKINFLLKNFKNLKTFINGDYLLKMGFKGKIIGEIIDKIKMKKIKGELKDKFDEIKFLENYLREK